MFYEQNKLIAVLPANRKESTLVSHGGLTYGGLILAPRTRAVTVGELFETMLTHCCETGLSTIRYKCTPAIYHRSPSEEDLYWLFRKGFSLVRRDISTTIKINSSRHLTKGRKWAMSRARQANLQITESSTLVAPVIEIATKNLEAKYGSKLTHSTEEMTLLADTFPSQIRTFGVHKENQLLGGSIVFVSGDVAHTQYIAFTDYGKDEFGFDALMLKWLNETFVNLQYLDFGISTEQEGQWLNTGLIEFKESFGGRATVCDTYELQTTAS
ncbi:MAG: GNAT family N-acetyltransferase [Rhodopirellula sp.]|nr:GNAT family N-acetyltransferase [Rhodopirellula sp.]